MSDFVTFWGLVMLVTVFAATNSQCCTAPTHSRHLHHHCHSCLSVMSACLPEPLCSSCLPSPSYSRMSSMCPKRVLNMMEWFMRDFNSMKVCVTVAELFVWCSCDVLIKVQHGYGSCLCIQRLSGRWQDCQVNTGPLYRLSLPAFHFVFPGCNSTSRPADGSLP